MQIENFKEQQGFYEQSPSILTQKLGAKFT